MKKFVFLATTLLLATSTVASADWAEKAADLGRSAGKIVGSTVGSAVGSAAREVLPSGDKIAVTAEMESLALTSTNSDHSTQAANLVESYSSDVSFVEAHTYIEGDAVFYTENCDTSCQQYINRVVVDSDGAGFSGVYAQAIITGAFKALSENSSGVTQAINSVRVGSQ